MMGVTDHRGTKAFYQVLRECIDAAENRNLITYKKVADHMPDVPKRGNYMAKQVGAMSGAVSREIIENDHPMLSALIVRTTDHEPGEGFWKFAYNEGVLDQDPDEMSDTEKEVFWENELDRVYEYWG